MTDLDDRALYSAIDKSDMGGHIRGLPGQCLSAWQQALEFKLPSGYAAAEKVLVLGMGGSAIGGDLLRALLSDRKKPLVLVSREYELPAWVDRKTLVIAASYSGNTEETLSAFAQALQIQCKKLVISTGGKISSLANENKVPVFVVKHVSQPRAALGYGLLPLLAITRNLGLSAVKPADVEGMANTLQRLCQEWDINVPAANNPAKSLAMKLNGKVPVIYGAGILTDAARRWKTQINENSKSWAFFETFSELNHNAVVGYRYPDSLKDKIFVALLRCAFLNQRTRLRYEITSEILKQSNIPHQFIDFEGPDALTQLMSAVLLGDWVSYYLAILNSTDPTPVPEIDFLKNRLSSSK